MRRFLILAVIFCLCSEITFAQDAQTRKSHGPRRQLATIVFAGLGGAVLGLSTLSFYGRPQDQLVNIAVGFAVGIIAGTTYVTFKSATTKEYYDGEETSEKKLSVSPFLTSRLETNPEVIKPDGGGARLNLNF